MCVFMSVCVVCVRVCAPVHVCVCECVYVVRLCISAAA